MKSLMPVAAGLAFLSLLAFAAGSLMLAAGVTMDAPIRGGVIDDAQAAGEAGAAEAEAAAEPAKESGGLLSSLRNAASRVLPVGGDAPEKPGYKDGHPVGLYLMTRFWMATSSLETSVWYFTSDGRVYVDLEDGFSEEKLAGHTGRQGTVRAEGDTMIVTWKEDGESKSDIERERDGFNWDGGIFASVEGFSSAEELEGRWEGGTSGTFGGTYASASRTFDLRGDGTFSGESAASLRAASSESVASAGSTGKSSGKWQLDGYALTFTYDDGRVVRGVTFPYDDEKTEVRPDRFYFAGTMYRKLSG